MIKKKDMDKYIGQMEDHTRDLGEKVYNMDVEFTSVKMVLSKKVNGQMEKE